MSFRVSSYLVPEGVILGQEAANANDVIGLLADHLRRARIVHPSYGSAAIAREATMPTGLPLGDGFAVAVPHTDPEHVITSGIALATLKSPVLFGSMDDPEAKIPVHIVFALALRSKDEQIDMLNAIGRLLQDGERLKRLSAANSAEEVASLLDAEP